MDEKEDRKNRLALNRQTRDGKPDIQRDMDTQTYVRTEEDRKRANRQTDTWTN